MNERTIIHVDMDAFFASVEQLDDPTLRGLPVLVGMRSRRGVVAAASYEARAFGCRSAMSMVEALRRCPEAVVVSPSRHRYSEVSRDVFRIFERFTPVVEGLSIDEAFLDVTASRALFGDGATIAQALRASIEKELHLTASAGVASNKFVAKIASDIHKPNGLTVVPAGSEAEFLAPLPVGRMWGVGPKAQALLQSVGVRTIGDLARSPVSSLTRALGARAEPIHYLARGIDARPVESVREAKSIGAETTFEFDFHSADALLEELLERASEVSHRLVRAELYGGTVTLKLKYADFQIVTRQCGLARPALDIDTVFQAARSLLRTVDDLHRGVRLLGISVSGLTSEPAPELFVDERHERHQRLAHTTESIRERFGAHQLTRGTLIKRDR